MTAEGQRLVSEGPNVLKTQIPISGGGWGVSDNQFPTFVPEFKFTEIPKGGGGGVSDDQFPTFVPEFKFTKIPKSHFWGGVHTQLFKVCFKLSKPNFLGEGGGGEVSAQWNLVMTSSVHLG